jgi:hypothetical protein
MITATATSDVTDELLDNVNDSLQRARMCTGDFTGNLRKAYQQDESVLTAITLQYRRRLYSEGVMYGSEVYPGTLELVKEVQEMLESYTLISFDDFADCVDDVRKDCLANSKRAKTAQHGHTYVLANLKSLENDIRQYLNVYRNRGADLQNSAVANRDRALNSQNLGIGAAAASTAIGPLVGLAVAPFDGGITALTLAAVGAAATMAGNQMTAKAVKQDNEAQSAYQNAMALGQLIQSLESLTEAVEIVAKFMALMANDLKEISCIGARTEFKKLHWNKIKSKAGKLVGSCRDFIAIEPCIRSDMLSIKEELENGYPESWKTGFQVYRTQYTL